MLSFLAGRVVLGALLLLQGGPQIPAPRGMVNDFANVLPAASVARMERVAQDVRAKSSGEIAVVTLPDLQGRDPAEVALRIGREWKVGNMAAIGDRSRNAGVVILLVPKETSSDGRGYCRVETGQGAEGFITDATSAAICREATPAFQQRDYATGIEIVTLLVAQRYATEFGFALGDVAGKGPPAALLAAVVQSNFGALAPVTREPAEMMRRLNQALLRRAIEARFATMCYGVAAPSGEFSYCNAGQEPPLVIAKNGIRWLETGGPVLGLLPSASYEYATEQLEPGDIVVVCSDGVTEARNVANEEFGRDRMLEAIQSMHNVKSDTILEQLLSAVNQFARGAPQADDITVLVFRYTGR